MAEMNNFSEITENFDTIKTLLNSIRAQGILNTSDVDKLLSGINSKLEKINTEEDIDLIKIFLSELKQNLDERHSVLISKFGAIESLFSNLLKNSADSLKSSEVKELFDIVATNLSVFSREVVSQKETLTDITLRLDAMRSDDSQKKDIIKNITVLKTDIDHLSNGFDSIVLSLNENFKTLIKTLSGVDQSEAIGQFGRELSDIVNSSNTILSGLQMLDKKNLQIEEFIKTLATQEDLGSVKKWISDLVAKNHELVESVDGLADKYYKIDNLAEKIDASVNIVAGLKTVIADNEDEHAKVILEEIKNLEAGIAQITNDQSLEEFKLSLQTVLKDISDGSLNIQNAFVNAASDIQKINSSLEALNIDIRFQNLSNELLKLEGHLKEQVVTSSDQLSQLVEVNVKRTLNDISSSADALSSKLKETHFAISSMCEKSFSAVVDDIASLKTIVSQIDENNVSANNAIFSNITDRLAIFENSLKDSLEKQEEYVSGSANDLLEQITNIKNITGVIDYKMDASVIEVNNAKREFSELKNSVNDILALDFVNVIKDLRVDLYAVKQDLSNAVEASTGDITDKFSNDLFGKYELLISKLDSVEDEIKQVQSSALGGMKSILENISSSIMDVISYVSVQKDYDVDGIDLKLANITQIVKENSLNYVENVRDVVEVIRVQVEKNLLQIQDETSKQIEKINSSIDKNTEALREEIKYSYNKLLEVKDAFDDIKEALNVNSINLNTNIDSIIASGAEIKSDFDFKLTNLKNLLLDKISDFKQEFTCENADKISELKFTSESMHSKSIQNSQDIKDELKGEIAQLIGSLKLNIEELSEQLAGTTHKVEGVNRDVANYIKNDLSSEVSIAVESLRSNVTEFSSGVENKLCDVEDGFTKLSESVDNLTQTTSSALTSTLAKILDNFVSLKSLLNSFNENYTVELNKSVEEIRNDFLKLSDRVDVVDSNIDEDLTRQLSIIERNFESLLISINNSFEKSENDLGEKISAGFNEISDRMNITVSENLEQYKSQVEHLFANITTKNSEQSEFIKQKALDLNRALQNAITEQNKVSNEQLQAISENLKSVLDENIALTSADYNSLRAKLEEFASRLEVLNQELVEGIKNHLSDVVKFVESGLELQAQEVNVKFDEISSKIQSTSSAIVELNNNVQKRVQTVNESISKLGNSVSDSLESSAVKLLNQLQEVSDEISSKSDQIASAIVAQMNDNTQKHAQMVNESILNMESSVSHSLENSSAQLLNQLKEASSEITSKNEQIASSIIIASADIKGDVQTFVSSELHDFAANMEAKLGLIESEINQGNESSANLLREQLKPVLDELKSAKDGVKDQISKLQFAISADLGLEVNSLYDRISSLMEELSLNITTGMTNTSSKYHEDLDLKVADLKASFELLNQRLDKDEISQMNIFQSQLKELSNTFNVLIEEAKSVTKSEVSAISETLIGNSKVLMEEVEQSIEDKVNSILAASADISAGELQSMEAFTNRILEKMEVIKQNSLTCKDLINDFTKKELDLISENIEKETDVIVKDLIEQFSLMRDSQKDELSKLSVHVESSIEDYIFNYINELKSYMDIKTDSTILNHKLDNLKNELNSSIENVLEDMDKFVSASVFDSRMSEIKTANEILISSMADRLNKEVQEFIKENVSDKFDEKLNLFDKKFIDTVVDKYEEIKLISSRYNNSFETIESSVQDLIARFMSSKDEINENITSVVNNINNSINQLSVSFDDLKSQILNKSFDEAFQASINSQISGIENLVKEQFGYLEDISDLCCNNLPEITEMNTIVKYGVQQSISDLALKVDLQSDSLEKDLNTLKSDIITQFLNIFNQISFVAEQEEILDFIQDKHAELITILSHIVTTVDGVETVKDNLAVVDNKMDSLREEVDLINEKITSIISSSGDIDYVYSLQDLESDIANLRLVLDEMKSDNKSKELEELIASTNDIYKLVDTIKTEMPKFELEEFKQDFEALSEDIVSISTRTNKLILASDESYKTLQDSLQDFKLVINDLDERTRNFAHEAGIDRIDNKLGSINTMIQNGAKTNQVFNQVFEYLAEWVDKAGDQINSISDRVETLDDIGQIKVMLEDLKAEAEDNSESTELIEALSNVFEKQAKKISSLEAKLDRVIVETTINNKNNKIDMSPFEDTLNRFLVAIGDKMAAEQDKIKSLEARLEEAMSMIDPKDTLQLTKKVGGMDRQIAKLNKSIEKIASHVIEK